MVTKIVITNHGSEKNKGDSALLKSRVAVLKRFIPNARFIVFTYHPEIENGLEDLTVFDVIGRVSKSRRIFQTFFYLVKCGLWAISQKYLNLDVKALRGGKLQEYCDADVILSTGGDVLTEDYGTLSFLSYVVNLFYALLLNKPVVLYAESIGPFKRKWNRIVAYFLLNRVRLITLREKSSMKYIEFGIDKVPIYVTADSAFLLEPAPPQRAKEILEKEGITEESRPLVGISVSKIVSIYGFDGLSLLSDKYREYIKLMAQIVDYLIANLRATVIFIPHVIEPWGNDDRTVAYDICKIAKNKQSIVSIENEYTTEEIKGMIGQCDLFIGARMHAAIASTSMYVPTIAIAYSHKTHGIIGEMLGYSEYIVDVREDFNYKVLVSTISKAWSNRLKISNELKVKIEDIKQRALLNAKLIKEFLENGDYK